MYSEAIASMLVSATAESYSLVMSPNLPEQSDRIGKGKKTNSWPCPSVHHVLVLDHPLDCDETVVQYGEFEEHGKEQGDAAIHKDGVERVHERRGVGEERDDDGNAGRQLALKSSRT